jgi:hypothetical protein
VILARYLNLFLNVVLLLILYLFIFRIVVMILKDLRRERSPAPEPGRAAETARVPGFAGPAALVVTESYDAGYPAGAKIELDKVIYIGRGESNRINLAGTYASHRHARIFFREGRYFLEDLGSTNGTYINGIRLTEPVVLEVGDLIKVAAVTMQFVRWEHEME